MQLLTTLTVIYVVVLVLALAASLIAILVYLIRIGGGLAKISRALQQAETNTSPLADCVETINGGLASVGAGLKSVDEHLAATNDSLNVVAAQLGIGEPA